MAETIASEILKAVLKTLASEAFKTYDRSKGIHSELKKLETTLIKIQSLLNHASQKETTDEAVKQWLNDFQHLAYDVDDVLDDLATEDMRRKLNQESGAMTSKASANVLFDPVHNSYIDLDVDKNPLLSEFSSILEFMGRIPVKKAMTDQWPLYRSHVSRFWENATYNEGSKVISSVVEVNGKLETILVTEALVREVMNFPDEANYPTRFPERMVKGCMLRMGYRGALNTGNYLKSKFQKSFKFLIHCILISLSHTKGSYDQMREQEKEEKARKQKNEKIRVALSRKPKPKEEKFKAI
ncbi:hypothetical protein HanPI659440_Chr16g0631471 [Helianthus annuus]|nr:hypothetical protein HanPI659440_Chr16g0631471 [Helianthus annuus]